MAGLMAGKGSMNGEQLLSRSTWDEIHSEPSYQQFLALGNGSIFTKGGYCYFDMDEAKKHEKIPYWTCDIMSNRFDEITNKHRKGYYGWMGYLGSIFQWDPELNIGFAYVPLEGFDFDAINYKGSFLQGVMRETVLKLKPTAGSN